MRLFTVLLVLSVAGCNPPDDIPVDDAATEDIVRQLASLPDWDETFAGRRDATRFGEAEFEAFDRVARALSVYSLAELERGFEAAIRDEDGGPTADTLSNGFVLIRVMFDVPATFPRAQVEVVNPYVGSTLAPGPVPEDFPLGWPVTLSPAGEVLDIAPMAGINGAGHALLDEMAWFDAEFGRRAWGD